MGEGQGRKASNVWGNLQPELVHLDVSQAEVLQATKALQRLDMLLCRMDVHLQHPQPRQLCSQVVKEGGGQQHGVREDQLLRPVEGEMCRKVGAGAACVHAHSLCGC